MLRKFYSETKGKGYMLIYLKENYCDDMQQILEIREKIRKDFPEIKDSQIMATKVGSKESNSCAGFTSLRFRVDKVENLDEFTLFFSKLKSDYRIVDHTADIKKYWSKVKGLGGYLVRYAIKEGHRSDMEYLMTLLEAVKADYPEVEEKEIFVKRLEYWYSEVLADVTVLEFKTSRVNFFEVEKFPLNEEPDC